MIYSIKLNFSETAPSTDVNLQQCFLLSVVVIMVYFDICSLIMFQSKKKKEKKKPAGLETAHVLHNCVPFDGAG